MGNYGKLWKKRSYYQNYPKGNIKNNTICGYINLINTYM